MTTMMLLRGRALARAAAAAATVISITIDERRQVHEDRDAGDVRRRCPAVRGPAGSELSSAVR